MSRNVPAIALVLAAIVVSAVAGLAQVPPSGPPGAPPAPTPVPLGEPMDAWRARINSAIKAETSILREMYRVESAEYQALAQLRAIDAQVTALEDGIGRAEVQIQELDQDTRRLRGLLSRRLRYMSQMNRANLARMLFRSDSIPSFLRRWRAVKWITARDRDRMLAYETRRHDLTREREDMIVRRRRLEDLRVQRQANTLQAQLEREKRSVLLDEIRRDRALAERASREMAAAREESDTAIASATETESPPAVSDPAQAGLVLDFASRRGYLKKPVAGPIVRYFGAVRNEQLGTVTRSTGIDIQAPEGAPVAAVADGVVRFAGEFLGYGRVVILDHGDRHHTMYGHLDRVLCEKGEAIRAGRTIGTVGTTGSLSGPALHFEIRYRGVAEDPIPWLSNAP